MVVPRNFHRLLRELGEVHDAEVADIQTQACRSQEEFERDTTPGECGVSAQPEDWAPAREEGLQPLPLSKAMSTKTSSVLWDTSFEFGSHDAVTNPAGDGHADACMNVRSSDLPTQCDFELHQGWRHASQNSQLNVSLSSMACSPQDELASVFASQSRNKGTISRLTEDMACLAHSIPFHPNARLRNFWEFISVLLLVSDIVTLPLQVFGISQSTTYSIFSLCFWSLDIPMSFLTGFHRESGQLVRLPRKVAWRYLSTWFLFDFVLVISDWVASVLIWTTDGHAEGTGLFRIAKSLRLGRNLRATGLIRIIKVKDLITRRFEGVCTQSMALVFELLLNLTSFIVLSHFVACVWFYVGSSGSGGGWVQEHEIQSSDFSTQYSYSMHWSVCQFTPAGMEVMPQNTSERIVAVVVILVAMVIFSSFLSSVSSGMTQLRMLRSRRTQQLFAIRKFLGENNIPPDLSLLINRDIALTIKRQSRFVRWQEVPMFNILSNALKLALHKELASPFLSKHTLFNELMALSSDSVQEFLDVVLQRQTFAAHDVLFKLGDSASRMHFMVRGALEYRLPRSSSLSGHAVIMKRGAWLSEAALWMPWMYQGLARTVDDSEVALLSARNFSQVATKHPDMYSLAKDRAHVFLDLISEETNKHDAPIELLSRDTPGGFTSTMRLSQIRTTQKRR